MMKNDNVKKGEITGIGGIFFKTREPGKLKSWYTEKLGIPTDEWGSMFTYRQHDNPDQIAYLQWSPMDQSSLYFNPSDKEFMINYTVRNLDVLLEDLKQKGVNILDEIEEFEYGRFVHILDPEGNKIELWEPIHQEVSPDNDSVHTED